MKSLTDELDEKAAVVDQDPLTVNLDVHLDEHLGSVQVADEQPFPARRRDDTEWAPAAVFISDQGTGRRS